MSTSTEQHSVSLAPRLVGIVALVLALVIGTSFLQSQRVDEVYAQASRATAETIRATQLALTAQVRFKKQVQEWKNILLRGGSDADLAKYRGQFFAESKKAQIAVLELLSLLPEDSDARRAAVSFAKAHQRLQGQYEQGLALFLEDRADPFRVDASVRGIDREPTDLLDDVVAGVAAWRLRSLDRAAAQVDEARRTAYGVQAFVCAVAVAFLFWALRSWVYRPLQAGIELAERVSTGDLNSTWRGRAAPGEVGRLLLALDRMRMSLRTMEDRKAKQRRQLEEARNRAQAGERAKSQFLSNMSHELRTPLNGILGNLSFLDDAVADRGVEHLRQAHRCAQELLTRVDRILTQTQRDSDPLELRIDVFEPRQTMARIEREQGTYARSARSPAQRGRRSARCRRRSSATATSCGRSWTSWSRTPSSSPTGASFPSASFPRRSFPKVFGSRSTTLGSAFPRAIAPGSSTSSPRLMTATTGATVVWGSAWPTASDWFRA